MLRRALRELRDLFAELPDRGARRLVANRAEAGSTGRHAVFDVLNESTIRSG
jgi:hypothetical protein